MSTKAKRRIILFVLFTLLFGVLTFGVYTVYVAEAAESYQELQPPSTEGTEMPETAYPEWSQYDCGVNIRYIQTSWYDPISYRFNYQNPGLLYVVDEHQNVLQFINWTFMNCEDFPPHTVCTWATYYVTPTIRYHLEGYILNDGVGYWIFPDQFTPPCTPNVSQVFLPYAVR